MSADFYRHNSGDAVNHGPELKAVVGLKKPSLTAPQSFIMIGTTRKAPREKALYLRVAYLSEIITASGVEPFPGEER